MSCKILTVSVDWALAACSAIAGAVHVHLGLQLDPTGHVMLQTLLPAHAAVKRSVCLLRC